MKLLSINSLVIGSFQLTQGPQGSSILHHVSKSSSLLKAVKHANMHVSHFIPSFISSYLGCFFLEATWLTELCV